MTTDIWVDPRFGSDRSGTGTITNPYLTPKYAIHNIGAVSNTIVHLKQGDYIDLPISNDGTIVPSFIGARRVKIVGHGLVRLISTQGGTALLLGRALSPESTTVMNIVFEGWDTVFLMDPSSDLLSTTATLILSNITANTNNTSSSIFFSYTTNQTNTLDLRVRNCTVRNYKTLYHAQKGSAPANNLNIANQYNCFFDNFTTMYDSTANGNITVGTSDYNAYDGNTETNGFDTTGVLRTDIYTNPSATPYADLSLKRGVSPSPLIGIGEYGRDIGASYYGATSNSTEDISNTYVATDWTGWINDDRWYPVGGPVGPDGDGGSSPSILTVSAPIEWVIKTSEGGGSTARILGPVWDTSSPTLPFEFRGLFKSVTWWSDEVIAGAGSNQVVDNSAGDSLREIEYRASDALFLQTDVTTGDIEWTLISKTDNISVSRRYWQFRVTLRNDGQ